ncbi:MAG TPA: LysR substrate-binding domain-containing protein [Myxococcales bacterium]|jgi:DNA-binding transcriptional LysR family regulator|nr:LysR substrate-binding domain-containing protein [Myxococcales bacterium]
MPDAVWLRRILPRAHVVSRSNNRDVQARMCAEGTGVAVLPRPLGDALAGVKRLNLGEDPPGRDTYVGYHRDLKRLARLRALLDLVIAKLSDDDSKPD